MKSGTPTDTTRPRVAPLAYGVAPGAPAPASSDLGPTGADTLLEGSPYEAYAYAYPHKTAYRRLDPPVPLADAWADEDLSSLFLYVHVPFCEMRCGFCNLFTRNRPEDGLPQRFVRTLEAQALRVRDALGPDARFVRVAFGGGTPTQLEPHLFESVLDLPERVFGRSLGVVPVSLETSPETATAERLRAAVVRGVDRISIGIQSFDPGELKALGRPQRIPEAEAALDRIRETGVAVLNVDLIYGMAGQTVASWLRSLRRALDWRPEELYLYPLYVRPRTGLGNLDRSWDDDRLACYRAGRDLLLSEGYEQWSMRLFRLPAEETDARRPVPPYRCQDDGMVGLGCGARSYTRTLHYSDDWAVGRTAVGHILDAWVRREPASFDRIEHGFRLDRDEQRRRWLIQSLSNADGLDVGEWRRRFGRPVEDDAPELTFLLDAGLVARDGEVLRPTPLGLERSDRIGPWLASDRVRERSGSFEVR